MEHIQEEIENWAICIYSKGMYGSRDTEIPLFAIKCTKTEAKHIAEEMTWARKPQFSVGSNDVSISYRPLHYIFTSYEEFEDYRQKKIQKNMLELAGKHSYNELSFDPYFGRPSCQITYYG